MAKNRVWLGDNLSVLRDLPDESVDLVYLDPPFNTGRTQRRHSTAFADTFDDYLGFLAPRLVELHRLLKPTGSLYLHLDWREVHYVKVHCDGLFGRDNFRNEIIWAYDFGGRAKNKWPAKHDTILVYAKDEAHCYFSQDDIARIPYMAPGLVGPEKAARGKLPTDVWWHTIVGTNSHEKTGYPTQKPLGILRRIVTASCPRGGLVCDPFAGSASMAVAAAEHGATFWMIDNNPEALAVMKTRLADMPNVEYLTT